MVQQSVELVINEKIGLKKEITLKKENIMAQVKVQEFVLEVKKCLKEAEEAIKQVLETYKKTESGVKSMNDEEEKAFLKEAFSFLYDSLDKKFELPSVADAIIKDVILPEVINRLFVVQVK